MSVVLVTGSSRGLGRSIALTYAEGGYDVIVHYQKEEEKARSVVKEIESFGRKAYLVKADLSKEEELDRMCDEIFEKTSVDVLVNNAAISKDSLVEFKTKEDFLRILDVNLVSVFLLSRKIGEKMKQRKQGVILNISSSNALDTYYEESLDYDASKAGLISLGHNLAKYFSPYVRVNTICPGWIETDSTKELSKEFREKEEKKILLHRFAKVEDIAPLVYFLGSDNASYINDSVIRIDGGVIR